MRLLIYITAILLAFHIEAFGETPIQKQIRGSSQSPIVMDGFEVTRFATGLGEISAMALDDTGTIYALDQNRGRVFQLTDRNKDGEVDMSRVIASGFVRPNGIATLGERLFISDVTGLYQIDGGKRQIASFQNVADMQGAPIIAAMPEQDSLMAALNLRSHQARLVKIDAQTGQASLYAQGPGSVSALAISDISQVWISVNGKLMSIAAPTFDMGDGFLISSEAEISGLLIPGQFPETETGLSRFEDHIFLSLGGMRASDAARQLRIIDTRLGQPFGESETFISGFLSKRGQTGWGYPTALIMDSRGIFMADKWSGTIWRINGAPKRRVVIKAVEPPKDEVIVAKTEAPELLLKGSQMTGSGIETASSLEVGSTILEAWEEEKRVKALEAEAEARGKLSGGKN